MERRVLLAIFLSFIVLYAYQALVVKPVPKPADVQSSERPADQTTPVPAESSSATNATPPPSTLAVPTAQPIVADGAERDIQVETSDVIAVFTNRGAR